MTDEQKNTPVGHMLDSAIILMQQQGSDQLTMGRVAEKSGYSLSTLYRLFPNKTQLIQGLANRELERFTNQTLEILRNYNPQTWADVEAGARLIVRAYIRRFDNQSWLRRRIIKNLLISNFDESFLERMDMVAYSTVHYLVANSNGLTGQLTRSQLFMLARSLVANVRTWHLLAYVEKNIPTLEDDMVFLMMQVLTARPPVCSA